MEFVTAYVLLVIFIATLIRSAFGFGEALFAVPLLAFRLPLTVATPLAVLISITIAGVVVVQDWQKIHWRSAGWLLTATLFGTPLGLLLLTSRHQGALKLTLGLFLIGFSVYCLRRRTKLPQLKSDSRAWLLGCGLFAGVLGGAYGMNGPPLVIYGTMRNWTPQHFRATLQGYFLPASVVGMLGYWLRGLWVPAVTHYYLESLPVMLPAIFAGRIVNHSLHGRSFVSAVYVCLAGIGAALLMQSTMT
ncbi:MAG: sulfite exporter TauE/SafE family protein [Acidobacteriaceae bacterium]|nr:sulfite exporter TauE/SafE family protein [Acidobacteriaceae bacterium]